MMNWTVPSATCRQLLGLTSAGNRVLCGKKVDRGIVGQERCPAHAEFSSPAIISFELRADLAERVVARADAYGVKPGDLITRVVEIGLKMNLDSEQ